MNYIHEETHRNMADTIPRLTEIINRVATRGGQPLSIEEETEVRRAMTLSSAAQTQLRQAGALPYQTKRSPS